MATENLGANFSIDISDLKAGLLEANRLIRESESEFREAAAGMDDWSDSAEGLQKRSQTLNTQIDLQRKKIDALVAARDETVRKMEAEGKTAEQIARAKDDYNKKITNESKQLDRLQGELSKTEKALDGMGKETKETGDELEKSSKAGDVFVGAIKGIAAAAVGAVTAFFGLAEGTRELRTNMAKLETSFTTAGHSAENAENTFAALYGILGDDGQATEAAAHLAQLTTNEQELSDWTNIATGVYATFGDSLPIEGLAEAANETAKVGKVTGPLADALNWAGVSEDAFNESLEACSNEQERQALITSTLNGLYDEAAQRYKEVNADVIAAQEAQANMNQALAELGAIAEPIMTTLKNLATDLLTSIMPFVSLIGEGLAGALEGSASAAGDLSAGITGLVETAVNKISEMLPFVLELLSNLVPDIITMLLGQLPTLVQFILDAIPQILDALSVAIPQIIAQIMELIPQLIQQLIAAIPQILDAAITLLMAIVDALPTIITNLVNALPSLINAAINALLQAIPMLIQASIQLFLAILDAIPVIVEALVQNLPTIIDTIINGLLNALPLLLEGAIQLFMAIIQALPTIIQMLIVELPKIITTIVSTLLSHIPDIIQGAVQLFMGIILAIPQIIVELVRQMPQIIASIVEGLKNGISNIKEVGKDLIRGLWNGISDMVGWIGEKIKGFGQSIVRGLKNFFGIKSPSRVMRDQIGKNLALGVGEGFDDAIVGVGADMTKALGRVMPSVTASITGSGVGSSVNVYQTNNYAQAHSRYELYKSKQATAAAVRLALGGA